MLTTKFCPGRRTVLKLAGSGLLTGYLGLGAIASQATDPVSDSLRVVGKAYLAKNPDEGSAERLVTALSRAAGLSPRKRRLSTKVLHQLVNNDFSTDNLVYLNGWALSRTEARLAALTTF